MWSSDFPTLYFASFPFNLHGMPSFLVFSLDCEFQTFMPGNFLVWSWRSMALNSFYCITLNAGRTSCLINKTNTWFERAVVGEERFPNRTDWKGVYSTSRQSNQQRRKSNQCQNNRDLGASPSLARMQCKSGAWWIMQPMRTLPSLLQFWNMAAILVGFCVDRKRSIFPGIVLLVGETGLWNRCNANSFHKRNSEVVESPARVREWSIGLEENTVGSGDIFGSFGR